MSKFRAVIIKLNGRNLTGIDYFDGKYVRFRNKAEVQYVGEGSSVEIAIRRARQKAIDNGEPLISGEILVEKKTTSQSDYFNDIEYRYYGTYGL